MVQYVALGNMISCCFPTTFVMNVTNPFDCLLFPERVADVLRPSVEGSNHSVAKLNERASGSIKFPDRMSTGP